MGFKKNNPGCNCCSTTCTICSGNCGWTQEAGSIDTVSFAPDLLIDGSNSIATCDADAAAGTVAVRASVTVVAGSGDVVKLGIKYVDANAYWYVELTPGSTGTLKLYERSGGTSTQRGPTMPVALTGDYTYGLTICYGSGLVRATESVSGIAIPYATTTSSTSGLSAFVGTGTIASAPLFSDFLYEYGYDASGHSTCTDCSCSATCEILSTAFTGGDTSDLGYGTPTGFEESSGSWEISSNQLLTTSGGVLLSNLTTPCGSIAMIVQVDFAHSNDSNSIDIIVGAVSSTDYWYVRYDFSANSISIRRNNGGAHSTIATAASSIALTSATTYTGKACVTEAGHITAYYGGTAYVTAYAQAVVGIRCGLAASAGNATFDNFSFYQADNAANSCTACDLVVATCSDCCLATQSGITFTLEWPTSFTHISAACNGFCEQLAAGDFSLSYVTTCVWRYSFSSSGCVDGCSDGQDPGGLGDSGCSRGGITLEIIRDTSVSPSQCYLRLSVTVANGSNTTSPDRQFVAASYESAVTTAQDFCSGDDFTLTLKTGIASTSDTYRGATGWYPNYSAGCNESLPASVVVHA